MPVTIVVGLVPCCNEVLGEPNCEQELVRSGFVEFGNLTYCCDLTGSEMSSFNEVAFVPGYGQAFGVLVTFLSMAVVEAESKALGGRESLLVKRLALGRFVLNTFVSG